MKTLLKYVLVLLTILFCHTAYACICLSPEWSPKAVFISYETHNLVFIGELINSNQDAETFSFRVVESLKGEIKSDTVDGNVVESCSTVPDVDGLWIIYASVDDKGLIEFSRCGLSRSLTTFTSVHPYPDSAATATVYNEIRKKELSLAMIDWMNEYILLKNLKEKMSQSALP